MIVITKKKEKLLRITVTVCENATPGTWGSHQLLLDQYRECDCSWTNTPQYEQMIFNENWLRSIEAKYGELHCEYCGKPNLKIIHWYEKPDLNIMATTDHFHPRKTHPHLARETKNFVVACHRCNNSKKAKKYTKNDIKFPYPEVRIF